MAIRPSRVEMERAQLGAKPFPFVGNELTVVAAVDKDALAALDRLWPEKIHVDTERLVADLQEDVLTVVERAVDTLALDERARVVVDVLVDLVQARLGEFQDRDQRMDLVAAGSSVVVGTDCAAVADSAAVDSAVG